MPNEAKKQSLSNTISLLRAVQQLLIQASRNSSDPARLARINAEMIMLDSIISQILHTQAIDDDALFAGATAALKQQASVLQIEENHISAIVTDIGVAAQILGYIAQAVSFLAVL